MTTLPKWTEDRTAELTAFADSQGDTISKTAVAEVAEKLETSARSVAAKLRKLGYKVETAAAAPKAFTDDEAAELSSFVTNNSGVYTYAEVAENFAGGKFTAKAIQGKILSLELTAHVRATPKPEAVRTYTEAEEATVLSMIQADAFVEDIAAAVNKPVASVRGKALSLFKSGQITAVPKQREIKGTAPDAYAALGDGIANLTVAEIAEKLDKTERGVKTTLTRRGIKVADYDGAAKKKKAHAE